MRPFRRRLRLAVIAWMVFQVVALSALVPKDCCQSHQAPAAKAGDSCHEAPEARYCPMRGQGRACPMHQAPEAAAQEDHSHHGGAQQAAASLDHHQHEQAPDDGCRLGGVCNAPAAALAVILSNHGVVPAGVLLPANAGFAPAAPVADERLVGCLIAPDNPPPRA